MFDFGLYTYLRDNFNFNSSLVKWGYGNLPDSTQTPYITYNIADDNRDDIVLCKLGDSGVISIDIVAYTELKLEDSHSVSIKLLRELEDFIKNTQDIGYDGNSYKILNVLHIGLRPLEVGNNLTPSVLSVQISYQKVG